MTDTIINTIRDTVFVVDTVVLQKSDTIFTVAREAAAWQISTAIATLILMAISISVAVLVFINQRRKSQLDAQIANYERLSKHPNLVLKEKILPGANDGDGIHLRIWNCGLGTARITKAEISWDGQAIKDLGSLAMGVDLIFQTREVTPREVFINSALFEVKEGQLLGAGEEFRLLEVMQGESYNDYIKNFTKYEMGIREKLKVLIEYESLYSVAGKSIRFPEDRTQYIIDSRRYLDSIP